MVGENGTPETPDWVAESRPSPFDAIFETPQHRMFMRGCDVALADAEVDALGTE